MQKSLLIVLVLGLSASVYALDLSHAAQPETPEVDPRIFNFINQLYADVVYPPLNHVVTNLALLGAQVLAGISATGIPAPGGRSVQLTEAELRGFWSGLWDTAIRPPIENALSGVSLLAAQILAGVGINGVDLTIGKRDLTVEDARILDALSQAFNNVFTNVIQKPLEDALSSGALMLAQVLAGVGVNGINLSNLGKRDLTDEDARIIDAFTQAINNVFANVIQKPLEDALSSGALMLAQVLAGIGVNGVNLSNLGKRELTTEDARILDALSQAFNNVFANVIQKPLEDALSSGALMLAQVLAGVGVNGINLSNLGKRELTTEDARIIDALTQALNNVFTNVIQKPLEDALSSGALMLAQVLAGVGVNGVNLSNLGKRELTTEDARIIDALTQAINNVFSNVIQKPLEDALSSGALMLAQVLAGIGVNGVNLSNLGKRELTTEDARILDALSQAFNNVFANVIQKPLEDALSSGALMLAQVLAGVGVNGINLSNLGKRELTTEDARIIDALTQAINNVFSNVIQKPLEDALSSGALMLAQVLAGIGVNGVNLSNLGKRELTTEDARIIDALTQALNNVFTNVIQKPLEDALSSGALMLAQVLAGVGVNGVNLSNLGKRELTTEDARILDALSQAFNNVFANVIQKPLEDALSSGALMLAQVLAGVGVNGINLSNLGKRDLNAEDARIIDALTQAINNVFTNVIQKPLEDALSSGALMLAQVLAGVGVNGVNLSNLGKRDLTDEDARIIDAFTQAINNVFANVIQKPLEDALSSGALMLAQVLAGIGVNGVNLSNLGKREVSANEAAIRGVLDTVGGAVVNGLQAVWNNIFALPLGNFIQNGALAGAQLLAGLGTNGVNLGKRSTDARGAIIDNLLEHAAGLYANQVKPVVENALNNAALQLAAVLANFSQSGFGRR